MGKLNDLQPLPSTYSKLLLHSEPFVSVSVPEQLPPLGPSQVQAEQPRSSEKLVYKTSPPLGYWSGQAGNACPSATTRTTHSCEGNGKPGVGAHSPLASEHAVSGRSVLSNWQMRASYCHVGASISDVGLALQVPPDGVGLAARMVPWLPLQPDTVEQPSAVGLAHSFPQLRSE